VSINNQGAFAPFFNKGLTMFKIVDISNGQVTYEIKNAQGEKIYYCLQCFSLEDNTKITFYRCSQPFRVMWDTFYEPSHEAKIKNMITIEIPKGETRVECLVRGFIEIHPLMEGV